MDAKKVGFYREFSYGDQNDPSITDAIRETTDYEKENVVNYLRSAPLLSVAPGLSRDVIDPLHPVIGTLSIRTDGIWEWPEDLAYYIEKYDLFLPTEFIEHMVYKGFIPPDDNEIDYGR